MEDIVEEFWCEKVHKNSGLHKFELSSRKRTSKSKLVPNAAHTHTNWKTFENNANDYYHYYFIVNWAHFH